MKNDPHAKGVTSQVVLGLLVIGMGLLFLLDNLGFVDMHRAFSFWPMVFVIVGAVKLCDTRTQGGTLLGAGLVGVGILSVLGLVAQYLKNVTAKQYPNRRQRREG